MNRKEYQKKWAAKKRAEKAKTVDTPVDNSTKFVDKPAKVSTQSVDSVSTTIDWQTGVDKSIFETKGRGVPVNGYVMISRGRGFEDNDGIVTEDVWRTRLGQTCAHGFEGWTCKRCL